MIWHHEVYYVPTEHPCACGRKFQRASGTTFLSCVCGETRWLVPSEVAS